MPIQRDALGRFAAAAGAAREASKEAVRSGKPEKHVAAGDKHMQAALAAKAAGKAGEAYQHERVGTEHYNRGAVQPSTQDLAARQVVDAKESAKTASKKAWQAGTSEAHAEAAVASSMAAQRADKAGYRSEARALQDTADVHRNQAGFAGRAAVQSKTATTPAVAKPSAAAADQRVSGPDYRPPAWRRKSRPS